MAVIWKQNPLSEVNSLDGEGSPLNMIAVNKPTVNTYKITPKASAERQPATIEHSSRIEFEISFNG